MKLSRHLFAIGLCLLFSSLMTAQVKTESTATKDQSTVETTVERGEVVYVSGNDLIVKMEDGQIRNFSNVPESARVTVAGQQLSIHDLKPGMKLERTITTTTTPGVVKTVQTVTGKVFQVRAPKSVTLILEDGTTQEFKIPDGQKFVVEGQQTDVFGLKKGMEVSATKIVEVPENAVSQQKTVTGEMPAPPPTAAIQGPLLIATETAPPQVAQAKPPAEVAQAEPQPKKLPQTASELPLLGLLGTLMLLSGIVVFAVRLRGHKGTAF